MVHEIATALLPVFFALALGFGAGLRGYVDNRDVSSINKLVMDFAIPVSLFVSISSTDRSDITAHAGYIVVTVIALAVVYAVTLVLQQRTFGLQKAEAAVQAVTIAYPNYASIGLPLSAAVVGARGPIFWAPMLAIVLVLCGVHMPDLVEKTLTPLGQAGAGAALFLTGLLLSAQKVSFGPNVAYGIVVKNGLMPLFVWGLCLLLDLDRLSTTEAVLLTAIPCGFFGLVFSASFGLQSRVAGSTLMLSTVAGIASLSVVIALLPQHV